MAQKIAALSPKQIDGEYKKIMRSFEGMKTDRRRIEDYYFEAAKWFDPRGMRNWCYTRSQRQQIKKNNHIFSNVGIIAKRRTVNFFMSNATPANGSWWEMALVDEELMEDQLNADWCKKAGREIQVQQAKTLYVALAKAFDDMVTSYGIIYQGYKRSGGKETTEIFYEHIRASSVWRRKDMYGEISEIAISRLIDPIDYLEMFGKEPAKRKSQNDRLVKVLQFVKRNPKPKKNPLDATDYAYQEFYIDTENEIVIHKGGYHTMPFFELSMYDDEDTGYPVGIAYDVLPEVKSANIAKKARDTAMAFAGRPPLGTAETDDVSRYGKDLRPGAILTGARNRDGKEMIGAIQGLVNPDVLDYQTNDDEARVREGLMQNELLQTHQSGNVTATAARIIAGERTAMVAPFINNIMPTLVRMCERHVVIAVESKTITLPPNAVIDEDIDVDIVSPMAMQARSHDLAGMMEAVQYMGAIAQFRPEIVNSFDVVDASKVIARATGTQDILDVELLQETISQATEQQEQSTQLQQEGAEAEVAGMQADALNKVLQ